MIPTTFDLDDYVFGAFRAGASGFLLKDAPRRRSWTPYAAAEGDALVAPGVTRRLIEHFVSPAAATRTPLPSWRSSPPGSARSSS